MCAGHELRTRRNTLHTTISHLSLGYHLRDERYVHAFFSSRVKSFQSFFCSSSSALNVDSCSAGVRVVQDASICAVVEQQASAERVQRRGEA